MCRGGGGGGVGVFLLFLLRSTTPVFEREVFPTAPEVTHHHLPPRNKMSADCRLPAAGESGGSRRPSPAPHHLRGTTALSRRKDQDGLPVAYSEAKPTLFSSPRPFRGH